MNQVEQRPYLTLHEAAQRLQKSVDDCYRMVRTGELPYVRVGRSIRIPFYAVEGLLSMQNAPANGQVAAGDTHTDNGAASAPPPAHEPLGKILAEAASAGPIASPGVAAATEADHPGPLAQPLQSIPTAQPLQPLQQPAQHPRQASQQPQRPGQPPQQVTQAAQPDDTPAGDQVKIRPPTSPWSQVPVVIQTRNTGAIGRAAGALRRAVEAKYNAAKETRLRLPFQAASMAVLVVSDSNLRAVVVRDRKVRHWGTIALKEGVVRDGAVADPQGFMSAIAALEARLSGPRLVSRPLGIVVGGRNLVIGRFLADIPNGPEARESIRRLACEKLSVRPEDVTIDFHVEDLEVDPGPEISTTPTAVAAANAVGTTPMQLPAQVNGKVAPGRRIVAGKAGQKRPAKVDAAIQREVVAVAALRTGLGSVLAPIAAARSRIVLAQPKAVALASAAAADTAIVVDLEPTSIAVIITKGGLAEVVRDVTVAPDLRPPQVAQILAGQVNRSVGYYNARYPADHLPATTPLYVTGEGAVDPSVIDLALSTLPYRRTEVESLFEAPENFPYGAYAAALGAARQELVSPRAHGQRSARAAFDFRPEEFKPRPLPMKKLAVASAAAVLLAGLAPAYQAVADVSAKGVALESTVGRLEPQVRMRTLQLRKIATLQEQLKASEAAAEKLAAAELAIKGTDRAFAETLGLIRSAVPAGVALGEVDDDGSLVEVAASATEPEGLFEFVRSLSVVEGFKDVRIKSIALDPSGVKATIKLSRDTAILSKPGQPALP